VTPWSAPRPLTSDDETVRLNAAIFQAFIELSNENRVIPLFAYFPGRPEIERLKRGEPTAAQRILKEIGIPIVDTTPCVMELTPDEAYIQGDPHYSARGNAAVAKCIGPALDQIFAERREQQAGSNQRR
jgi:hypothetical protein